MSEVIIRELNISDENDLKMYEEALYKAFFSDRRVSEDAARIYDYKNKRSITKIPYDQQYIHVAQLGAKIVTAVCANFNNENMQVKLRGFEIVKNNKTCEVLHIFNNSGQIGTDILRNLGNILLSIIKMKDLTYIYSTCIERRLIAYQSFGFEIVNVKTENKEKRYLLKMVL
jgi:hypothetical protein